LGDALDHVVDQRAHQAVAGADGALVALAGDLDLRLVHLDLHAVGEHPLQLALRPLDRQVAVPERDLHAAGNGNRLLANARHYQTSQMTSPPMPCLRASRSVMMPFDVEMMAVPSPRRTRGSLSEGT